MKINVVCVGKVKENYFLDGINEYKKRLSKYCDFTITELKEENFDKVDDALINTIKKREAERILPNLKGYVIVTDINGKKATSVELASLLKAKGDEKGVITFVIGGSYGLDQSIKDKADYKISFSDMTFPHTLFRLMLTEQIYRAFTIINGSNYHK
ncbi:MAG: 23S rRNA (pseudouridine(1915)-N(3))-methyltransferase RlmH [Clostridia bacterium]|nr:23S rRNA (pseudouridine(1915)-N(3))-methyltransferase RlmH [Clostridia bacterium]